MVKAVQQDRNHPLFGLLNEQLDCQRDIIDTAIRIRPKTRSKTGKAVFSDLGRHIFSHCAEMWYALPEEARQWYQDHAPAQFCTGFLWWTWSCLIKNYGAGPWTVKASPVGGHSYIRPIGAPEGIYAKGYTGATEIGTLAHIDWEEGCPAEEYPILLVHGWYLTAFAPHGTWKWMTKELTGKDPTKSPDVEWIYDPEHPGDVDWALRRIEGDGRIVYISNYTHDPMAGVPDRLDEYALSLAREIEVLCAHEGVEKVNIVTHSLGGLVTRAYIENEDLPVGFQQINYRGDVNALIMIAPPNQGCYLADIIPEWSPWDSLEMIKHGSEFLTNLNSGVTGREKGVEYSIIAGNYFGCPPGWAGTFDLTKELDMLWVELIGALDTFYMSQYAHDISRRDIIIAASICGLSGFETNDGAITVEDTKLSYQGGKPEVPGERFYILPLTHAGLLGTVRLPCDTAITVKIILANYTIEKWRDKGKKIEPSEANFIQRCLSLIERTDAAREVYNHIVDTNVDVDFGDVPVGFLAMYFPDENAIHVDPDAEGEEEKAVSQHIVHEGERSRWKGENSISQEYHAFKAEADFWNTVKKGDTDDHCDWVAGFVAQGKQVAMDYIRTLSEFEDLPEYSGLDEYIPEAFTILDYSTTGYPYALFIQREGVTVIYGDRFPEATAWYLPSLRAIQVNYNLFGYPPQVPAAYIAHESLHAEWDRCNSINQEYHAFKRQTEVWKEIKGDAEEEGLDWILKLYTFSEDIIKDWIREQPAYEDLPEYCP